jgi:hypothetical protein
LITSWSKADQIRPTAPPTKEATANGGAMVADSVSEISQAIAVASFVNTTA